MIYAAIVWSSAVMSITTRTRPRSEIKLLMEGKAADILDRCITCNACFQYCPTGADPADLIYKMQEKIGTGSIVASFKPFIDS